MKMLKTLWLVLIAIITGGCSTAWPKGNMNSNKQPAEPCVAERIDGGVKITCPTSEAIVYDGEIGPSAEPVQGEPGESCEVTPEGVVTCPNSTYELPKPANGTSCTVSAGGLVQCGSTSYQLPIAVQDECTYVLLGNTQ